MPGRFSLVQKICLVFLILSGVMVAFMFLFTLTNVVIRQFGRPIFGDYEIVSFLGATVFGFSVPYTALKKMHVKVDFLLEMISAKVSARMQIVTRIFVIAFSLLLACSLVSLSVDMIISKEVTQTLRVPVYPISLALALAFVIHCLPLISEIRTLWRGQYE